MVVLAVTAVAVGALLGSTQPETPIAVPETTAPGPVATGDNETVPVHVSGMVVSPGVVYVSGQAIVADAVEAAGGLRPEARAELVNLAAPVGPGDQIVIPGPDSSVDSGPGAGGGGGGSGPLTLNQASAAEFETLPGVGAVLAERIVAHRDANGRFDAVEDLLDVPGIGEAKLAAIRDLVRP